MGCVINIKSNEADGQDSSVHSFFYLLVYDIVTNLVLEMCKNR